MKNPTLFWVQAVLLIGIAALHAYALSVDLYWHQPLANRIIHFSGGVWVAFAAVWAIEWWGAPRSLPRILAIVILVSVAWEIFEIAIGVARQEANYLADTTFDLIMDLFGGILGAYAASFMVQSRAMPAQEPKVASSRVGVSQE